MNEPTVSVVQGLAYAILFLLCGAVTFLAGNFYYQIRKIEPLKYLGYLALSATIDYGFRTVAVVMGYIGIGSGLVWLETVAQWIAATGQLSSFIGWCIIGTFMLGWFRKGWREKKSEGEKTGP